MKDSGIQWIGSIPDKWSIEKVKYNFRISKEKAHDESPIVLKLARKAIEIRDISTNEGQLAANYEDYNPVVPGDLLLNPMDLYSGANCNVSEVSGVISPAYANLRSIKLLNPKYYDFYFKYQYWFMTMFAHGKGVSYENRWTMNAETLLNYWLPIPPYDEQNAIVNYLKSKTLSIDSLIESERRQIEKLIEYKETIIGEVVTKGIYKNIALKDSGIEWIGKMPSHWTLDKTIRIFEEIGSGTTPKGDEYYFNGDINWIQSGDINGGYITECTNKINENAMNDYSSLKLYKAPFLIMAMYGGSVGHLSMSMIDGCVNQACCVMKNPYFDYKFAYYCLFAVKEHLLKNAIGGGQPNISQTIIKQLWFPKPDLDEQKKIVDYLDEKQRKIDRLIDVDVGEFLVGGYFISSKWVGAKIELFSFPFYFSLKKYFKYYSKPC